MNLPEMRVQSGLSPGAAMELSGGLAFLILIADQIARAHNYTRSPRSDQEQDLRIALEAFAMKKVKPSNIQLLRPTHTLRLVQVQTQH
jgi:hypothetical protein